MHPAKVRRFAAASGAVVTAVVSGMVELGGTGSAPSAPTPTQVQMIEWALPAQMDNQPGAVMVDVTGDGNRLWFVTRLQEVEAPRVYRLELHGGKKVEKAQWVSWQLDPVNVSVANGIRRIKTSGDKRFVFVHTAVSLQRIDTVNCTTALMTVTCPRTTWIHNNTFKNGVQTPDPNGPVSTLHGSDVAIDEFNNNVFTALASQDPTKSFIQRLNPSLSTNNVTRWYVGNSVGFCPGSQDSAPCLSGVAIDRRNRDLVYYSEPTGPDGTGAIAELDTRKNAVRRWSFTDLASASGDLTIREPRQLIFDNDGTLWTVTGSGHLVSLDPRKSRMSKHLMPTQDPFKDPFGIAPDGGLIGYTDASVFEPRVGMLMPARRFFTVSPSLPTSLTPGVFTIPGDNSMRATQTSGVTPPNIKTVPGQIVRNADGTFSEALTFGVADMPLGVTQDQSASEGTFFFAIGDPADLTLNRIGRVRLPRQDMRGRVERDDDDNDDDGKRADMDDDVDDDGLANAFDIDSDNDGIPDLSDDDDDNDGIEDSFDTKDKKEFKQTSQQDLVAGETGEDPFTLNPNTLLAVLSAVSTDPLAMVKVEVVDAAGSVVASSLNTPGAATITFLPPAAGGNYTLRVKNQSSSAGTISTKILTRELWPVTVISGVI